jgi:hypothetical protein
MRSAGFGSDGVRVVYTINNVITIVMNDDR